MFVRWANHLQNATWQCLIQLNLLWYNIVTSLSLSACSYKFNSFIVFHGKDSDKQIFKITPLFWVYLNAINLSNQQVADFYDLKSFNIKDHVLFHIFIIFDLIHCTVNQLNFAAVKFCALPISLYFAHFNFAFWYLRIFLDKKLA